MPLPLLPLTLRKYFASIGKKIDVVPAINHKIYKLPATFPRINQNIIVETTEITNEIIERILTLFLIISPPFKLVNM